MARDLTVDVNEIINEETQRGGSREDFQRTIAERVSALFASATATDVKHTQKLLSGDDSSES